MLLKYIFTTIIAICCSSYYSFSLSTSQYRNKQIEEVVVSDTVVYYRFSKDDIINDTLSLNYKPKRRSDKATLYNSNSGQEYFKTKMKGAWTYTYPTLSNDVLLIKSGGTSLIKRYIFKKSKYWKDYICLVDIKTGEKIEKHRFRYYEIGSIIGEHNGEFYFTGPFYRGKKDKFRKEVIVISDKGVEYIKNPITKYKTNETDVWLSYYNNYAIGFYEKKYDSEEIKYYALLNEEKEPTEIKGGIGNICTYNENKIFYCGDKNYIVKEGVGAVEINLMEKSQLMSEIYKLGYIYSLLGVYSRIINNKQIFILSVDNKNYESLGMKAFSYNIDTGEFKEEVYKEE